VAGGRGRRDHHGGNNTIVRHKKESMVAPVCITISPLWGTHAGAHHTHILSGRDKSRDECSMQRCSVFESWIWRRGGRAEPGGIFPARTKEAEGERENPTRERGNRIFRGLLLTHLSRRPMSGTTKLPPLY
jgi:hypothetical protein